MTTDKKILRRGLTALSLVTALGLTSCTKDLDRFPTNGETSQTIYNSPAKTFQAFAKVYGAFALSGNGGKNEDGNGGDIAGIDEGASDFVRGLFNLQELPTETAICAWGDGGVPDLHAMSWSSSNPIIRGLYYPLDLSGQARLRVPQEHRVAGLRCYGPHLPRRSSLPTCLPVLGAHRPLRQSSLRRRVHAYG